MCEVSTLLYLHYMQNKTNAGPEFVEYVRRVLRGSGCLLRCISVLIMERAWATCLYLYFSSFLTDAHFTGLTSCVSFYINAFLLWREQDIFPFLTFHVHRIAFLFQKSPELQEEFIYNAETQRTLTKNGETLLGALNFFVSSVNTLCNKTMEDTLLTVKLYESSR